MSGKQIRIISLLVLDTLFFLLEAIVGYSVHSLALIADSFHMLNDIISLIIALWAVRVKETRKACGKYTYGWQRAEILGALVNAVFLLALCFTIIIEAIQRFFEPQVISNPKLILVVGVAGLASNFIGLVLFHEHGHSHSHGGGSGHSHSHAEDDHDEEAVIGSAPAPAAPRPPFSTDNGSSSDISSYLPDRFIESYNERTALLPKNGEHEHSHQHSEGDEHAQAPKKQKSMNMEGVFLHVMGDALGNIGVIIAALFIWKTDYSWKYLTDPLISLVITVIIFSSALPLCKKSAKILLQASPPYLNSNALIQDIVSLDSVKSLHDFHVWNLNEDILIASLHLELASNSEDSIRKTEFVCAVGQVREILHRYGIHSATIQPEFGELEATLPEIDSYGAITKDHCQLDEVANCSDACLRQ